MGGQQKKKLLSSLCKWEAQQSEDHQAATPFSFSSSSLGASPETFPSQASLSPDCAFTTAQKQAGPHLHTAFQPQPALPTGQLPTYLEAK